jgi:hypothetical protein
LRVISSSPGDLKPVFDTIVRRFALLCGSVFGSIFTFDGELKLRGRSGTVHRKRYGTLAKPTNVRLASVRLNVKRAEARAEGNRKLNARIRKHAEEVNERAEKHRRQGSSETDLALNLVSVE